MKKNIFIKGMLVFSLVCIFSMIASAVSPRNYVYDTKMDGDKIVSKVVYIEEGGLLKKEIKYDFTYDEKGDVIEKIACRWDGSKNEWSNLYRVTYQHETDGIHSNYCMWCKKSKTYSLNPQNMVLTEDNYESIFS